MILKPLRSPLKWAGGKLPHIKKLKRDILDGQRLVELFVGGGSLFLNLDYHEYLLCDNNPDLINYYTTVQSDVSQYIDATRTLFTEKTNTKDAYYSMRKDFNNTSDLFYKAALFLYLNRHGYNGL